MPDYLIITKLDSDTKTERIVRAKNQAAALKHQRTALMIVRDRQSGRASEADLNQGIALIDAALAENPAPGESTTADREPMAKAPVSPDTGAPNALGVFRVPDGWQLVPIEPTNGMLSDGSRAADGYGSPWTRTEHAYKAMLAAVPPLPPCNMDVVHSQCNFEEKP